jgi:PD-(D/E)XK nuclease superfamily
MLEEFKSTVEAEAVNAFWDKRATGKLKKRPEKLAQEILGVFMSAKLAGRGAAIREPVSGIGFIDMVVMLSSGLIHVLELKILKTKVPQGHAQLLTYMNHKKRKEGWLVLFDTRAAENRNIVAPITKHSGRTIRTILIDINPAPPSKLKLAS